MNMNAIKAVVVDDEINNVDLLIHFLTKYCPLVTVVGKAITKASAKDLIEELKPDLIFLDIELDEGTGFDLLDSLTYNNAKVIFVTAYNDFAIRAFKYAAVDYILKPLDIESLVLAVNKAYKDIEKDDFTENMQIKNLYNSIQENTTNLITLASVNKIDLVKLENIIYLKSDGRYTLFVLDGNRELVVTKNIGEYEILLDNSNFFRIHKSYIINLNKVSSINKAGGVYCEMVNKKSLPVAKRRQDLLFKNLNI